MFWIAINLYSGFKKRSILHALHLEKYSNSEHVEEYLKKKS